MMNTRVNRLVALGAALLLGASAFAQQQSKPANQSQQATNQGGQAMKMDDMMKSCREHCQSTMTSISQTQATMAQARQSNDPAQMRAALEQGDKSLTEMNNHMSMCMSMMNMMGGMHGGNMSGMMSKPRNRSHRRSPRPMKSNQ